MNIDFKRHQRNFSKWANIHFIKIDMVNIGQMAGHGWCREKLGMN